MCHKDKFEYMCHKFNKQNALSELPFVNELFHYITLLLCVWWNFTRASSSTSRSWDFSIKWSFMVSPLWSHKASWVLSVFHTLSHDITLTLCKLIVRCLVEYYCRLWNPTKISDIQELESVQKTFTARIAGMWDLHYWDRLVHLSLQCRRERFIILINPSLIRENMGHWLMAPHYFKSFSDHFFGHKLLVGGL